MTCHKRLSFLRRIIVLLAAVVSVGLAFARPLCLNAADEHSYLLTNPWSVTEINTVYGGNNRIFGRVSVSQLYELDAPLVGPTYIELSASSALTFEMYVSTLEGDTDSWEVDYTDVLAGPNGIAGPHVNITIVMWCGESSYTIVVDQHRGLELWREQAYAILIGQRYVDGTFVKEWARYPLSLDMWGLPIDKIEITIDWFFSDTYIQETGMPVRHYIFDNVDDWSFYQYELNINFLSDPYQVGYDAGYSAGFEDGLADGDVIGYNRGYEDGLADGSVGFDGFTWIKNIVVDVAGGFLTIEIYPGLSVGTLVAIPFILTLTAWIIGLIRAKTRPGDRDD